MSRGFKNRRLGRKRRLKRGERRLVDTGGQVAKFNKRFGNFGLKS